MGNILKCFRVPEDNNQVINPAANSPAAGDNSNRQDAVVPVPIRGSAPEDETTTVDESGDQSSFLGTETETSEVEERGRRQRRGTGQSQMSPRSKAIKKRKKKPKAQKPKKQ